MNRRDIVDFMYANRRSELQFQRELHRARATNLVESVKPAAQAASTEAGAKHLLRSSERGNRGNCIDRIRKIGMIEDVEDVDSGLQVQSLSKIELASQ